MYTDILYDVSGPVATLTLNRPDRLNATTPRMMQEIRHAVDAAEKNADVVGIVITGAEFGRGLTYLLTVRKPIIAAINGPCAGYGLSLAMFCDLRFTADGAIFTTAFSQRGLVAEHGQSWMLPRVIGPSRALDLFWSARRFDANEALALGVVNRVFPGDKLIVQTNAYIKELAEKCSPTSLMIMKQQVYRHLMMPLGASMKESDRLQAESVTRPDFGEGIASYTEKRAPNFARIDVG
jgi:enoyl-CoA hydratase/carnithine racemase